MKETGINWFYDTLGLDTGAFAVFYTFENGAGTSVSSVPSGQAVYSGTLASATNFWNKPGSGYFNGYSLTINNASGLASTSWTDIFVYEKVNTDDCVLFNSLSANSGYKIGITRTNKPYFESYNGGPVVGASLNNYSDKNAVTFTYLPNYLVIGYYNFNSKTVESESFDYPFSVAASDNRKIGTSFTGYMDYYIHLTQPISPQIQAQLLSGLFAYPTGQGYAVSYIYTTGITGYQDIQVITTGVTGYVITPLGDQGRDYYTGQFPTNFTSTSLTGIMSSGLFSSGITGVIIYPETGSTTTLYALLTGYASSFGMKKVQIFADIQTGDIVKQSVSYTQFDDNYNKTALNQYSGYTVNSNYTTGYINSYLNGVAQACQGWTLNSGFVFVSGANASDSFYFDTKSGSHNTIIVLNGITGYALAFSGQEVFLNGVNLISGYDFLTNAGNIYITNKNTGITGYLFEYPIVLSIFTGNFNISTGLTFQRNTSNIYVNGIRQQNYLTYTEGAIFDLLSGNNYNPSLCTELYNNNNNYWEKV